jgi:hypothetical protein
VGLSKEISGSVAPRHSHADALRHHRRGGVNVGHLISGKEISRVNSSNPANRGISHRDSFVMKIGNDIDGDRGHIIATAGRQ